MTDVIQEAQAVETEVKADVAAVEAGPAKVETEVKAEETAVEVDVADIEAEPAKVEAEVKADVKTEEVKAKGIIARFIAAIKALLGKL